MSHSVPDKEALTSVWEAVKNRSIPLKSLTKAEYDALDETSKNADVVYLVQSAIGLSLMYKEVDLISTESSGEIYSTEETRIGTWIDGKPLYRKVYQVAGPTTTSGSISAFPVPGNVVNLSGFVKVNAGNSILYFPTTTNGPGIYYAAWVSSGNVCIYTTGSSWATGAPCTIILEYTKTTD